RPTAVRKARHSSSVPGTPNTGTTTWTSSTVVRSVGVGCTRPRSSRKRAAARSESASAVTLSGAAARTRPAKARIPSGTTVTDQGEPPSATRPDRHLTPGVQVTGPAAAVSTPVRSGGAGTGVICAEPGVGASLLSGDPSSGKRVARCLWASCRTRIVRWQHWSDPIHDVPAGFRWLLGHAYIRVSVVADLVEDHEQPIAGGGGEEEVRPGWCEFGERRLVQPGGRYHSVCGEFVDNQVDEPDLGGRVARVGKEL